MGKCWERCWCWFHWCRSLRAGCEAPGSQSNKQKKPDPERHKSGVFLLFCNNTEAQIWPKTDQQNENSSDTNFTVFLNVHPLNVNICKCLKTTTKPPQKPKIVYWTFLIHKLIINTCSLQPQMSRGATWPVKFAPQTVQLSGTIFSGG